MLKLIGSSYLTQPVGEVVQLPKFIRIKEINDEAVGTLRDGITEAIGAGFPVIPIVIDSQGGAVYSLLACLDLIAAAKQHAIVATIVEGKALSSAADLLASGSKGYRYVGHNATVMIHQANGGSQGKLSDLNTDVAEFKRLDAKTARILDKNTGHALGYFQKAFKARGNTDWYLGASGVVKLGLADKIGTPTYIVKVGVDFGFE